MLPAYAPTLNAYHAAFERELNSLIGQLPFCAGDRILDAGCGDGFYLDGLARLVVPDGQIVGLDRSADYLAAARRRWKRSAFRRSIQLRRGRIERLPFPARSFDGVWCAQSFYSFPEPEAALREMARVLRPGGIVAILENDSLHQVLLPWPPGAELALLSAEFRRLARTSAHPGKFYMVRHVRGLLQRCGLKPQRKRLFAWQREAPLSVADQRFLTGYLKGLWERTQEDLDTAWRTRLEPLFMPRSRRYLARRPDLTFTCLDQVVWAKKP